MAPSYTDYPGWAFPIWSLTPGDSAALSPSAHPLQCTWLHMLAALHPLPRLSQGKQCSGMLSTCLK